MWLRLSLAMALVAIGFAQPADPTSTPAAPTSGVPTSVPASRSADRVAVLTVEGEIDAWTARSIERRIAAAEAGGYDAIVIDLDTPGGAVDAVLRITNALKASSIPNTVAWVNRQAYSGGAIIAVACREIVVNDPSSMGDAFPVTMAFNENRPGLRGLTPDERTKILPVLMSDVVHSARRNGYDEFLVQAMVIDGIELWLVEDTTTGETYAINEREYRALFNAEPPRGAPMLAGATGGRYEATPEGPRQVNPGTVSETVPEQPGETEPRDADAEPRAGDSPATASEPADDSAASEAGTSEAAPVESEPTPEERRFVPASDELRDVAQAFDEESRRLDLEIAERTRRPDFASLDAQRRADFVRAGYICDGTSAIVMNADDMRDLGFAPQVIQNDAQLLAFFGATDLDRSDMSLTEHGARFLTNPLVRGALIVVLLLGIFVEMVSPGLVLPGSLALGAIVLLLAPPLLVGLAGWWEVVAIIAGLALLGVELFVLPGFGVFGVIGIVALFGGLVGTFLPNDAGLMSDADSRERLIWATSTVLLAVITSLVGMYFIGRHFGSIPLLSRLVLDASGEDTPETTLTAMGAAERTVNVGDLGKTLTPLRPSGSAEFDGRPIDVVSGLGYIEAETDVEVTEIEGYRVVVEPATKRPHADEGTDEEATA